jgi:hypothetical protein
MKQLFLSLFIAGMAIQASAQANKHLSNLDTFTAVNLHLLPNGNNIRDLGSPGFSWRNLYLDSYIYMDDIIFVHNSGLHSTFVGGQAGNVNNGSYNSGFGYRSLFNNISGTNNTANGANALWANTTGTYNTGTGSFALYQNTTGNYNTAYGMNALSANISGGGNTANGVSSLHSNNTGSMNTAIGMEALFSNNTGSANTASGFWALFSNKSGSRNVAIGNKALYSSINNSGNVAIGDSALYKYNDASFVYNYMVAVGQYALASNTNGYFNTSTGGYSLFRNTTGNSNTANGAFTLSANTIGSCNTAVGYSSLDDFKAGNNNTAIGCSADVSSGTISNATAIGSGAIATANDQVMLGNTYVTSVKAAGSFVIMSDGRFKNNRNENVPGLSFIKELKPVTYNYDIHKLNDHMGKGESKTDQSGRSDECCKTEKEQAIANKEKKLYTGFIAQEVEAAADKIGYDFSGVYKPQNNNDSYGLSYSDFVVPLVKAVQELSQENDELKSEMEKLKSEMKELRTTILSANQSGITPNNKFEAVKLSSATLDQNIPNPFQNTTTIKYTLPSERVNAYIIITDKSGKTIKQINVSGSGKGSLNVDASTLGAGAYSYSLYIGGRLASTKQMILAK